ncbi:MAG TPA: ribosome biogenesis GTPase Der [Candidatus Onthovivens sp.]|nr:ribosome biogenesis GTPase Der [Candidatus Onthovivens sp.]
MKKGLVAIVGSPSVGKSTIFNRIIGEKKAIIEPQRGVTRDRLYSEATWLTRSFNIVDTGGIELENKPFQAEIRMQAEIAIREADIILFVVDGQIGLSDDDKVVASMLHKSDKKVILAVNKIDDIANLDQIYEFYNLGIGDPIACSGEHGIGIGDILDEIIKFLPEIEEEEYDDNQIHFCLIGRPNVGKSSLTNALLNEDRVIVSDISGTTRDSIDTPFVKDGKNYVAIDTAGLKKRGKIYESIDKYAALRALRAIDKSDVAILLIDASQGIIEQDKHVVGYAMDAKKAIILVVNKWDLGVKKGLTQKEFIEDIRKQFKFLDYVPIIFTSAISGKNVNSIFKFINKVYESYTYQIKTSALNVIIQEAQLMNETPMFNGGRLRIYFGQQVSSKPVGIALFCNDPLYMHFSYLRYIENKIRDSFALVGSPINLILRKRK